MKLHRTQNTELKSKPLNLTLPFLLIISSATFADLPLTIEDLLSKKGETRFQLSVSYLNTENRSGDLLIKQYQAQNDNTEIPQTVLGESFDNTDSVVSTVTVRHGVSKNTEIYGRISGVISNKRSHNFLSPEIKNDSRNHFSSSWIGVNHRFREDFDNKPALLGFSEIQVAQKNTESSSTVYGKSLIIGGTTYQTYDPVVLSLTGQIQLNTKQKQNKLNLQLGHALTLTPSIGFAVNDKVTLTTGFNWRIQQENKINGKKKTLMKTSTDINLGLGYAYSKKITLSANIQPNVSGNNGVQANMVWAYKMDK